MKIDFWLRHLNYKKIWKRETVTAKFLAWFISNKRKHINYPLNRFKRKWYRLINRIQIIGLSNRQKVDIVMLRQHYKHKTKTIVKKTGLSRTKVMAVLYHYNCWKIKDYRDKEVKKEIKPEEIEAS